MEWENGAKLKVSTEPWARECDSDKQEALATSGARTVWSFIGKMKGHFIILHHMIGTIHLEVNPV